MIFGKPLVSVLLTSYNNPMVKDAIKSVLNQTYQNFELILLDDNSNKKTLKLYKPYLDNPRVIFYNSHIKEKDRLKECPYARQINVGLKMAKGKLITYMCDDVVYLPQKLETMINFLKRHPTVKVCYNRQQQTLHGKIPKNFKDHFKILGPDRIFRNPFKILGPDRILRDPFCRVDHNSVMHYKSCIDVVGDWDTHPISYGVADAVFWRKLGKKFLFYPILEVLEINYIHDKSFSSRLQRGEL